MNKRQRETGRHFFAICAALACGMLASLADGNSLSSRSGNLTIVISDAGEITDIALRGAGGDTLQRSAIGRSIIAGTTSGEVLQQRLDNGSVQYRRVVSAAAGQAVVTQRFSQGEDDASINWELEITGSGAPWTAPIQTYLELLHDQNDFRFWSAWTRSDLPQYNGYGNPLEPMDFSELHMKYGGNGSGAANPTLGFSVPIAMWLNSEQDLGLTLMQSPFDFVQDMTLHTSAAGAVNFERTSLRIAQSNTIKMKMHLAAHSAAWRAGMGFMVTRYPDSFNPHVPFAHEVGGGATYADYRGEELDAEKLRGMGFTMNWSATFPWPYIGMSIPPVKSNDETWQSIGGTENSGHKIVSTSMCAAVVNGYAGRMREQGFHQLEYFTVTEAGNFISPTPTVREAVKDEDLWRSANDFIYHQIPDANLGIGSWLDSRVVDPGDPAWQAEIVRQITDICVRLPLCSGVVIDRMDWLSKYNNKGDDGVTWSGTPKRSLLYSWHQVMERMISLTKEHNKVVFGNVKEFRRVDAIRHLDGVYNEFNSTGIHNLIALAGLRKPVMIWGSPNSDAGFQEYLYLGIFPSVPFPKANHNTLPDTELENRFIDYGAMFNAMRGKKWVMIPHVIQVDGSHALANIFEVEDGYVIPVVFGGASRTARITVKHLPFNDLKVLEIVHPGKTRWMKLMNVGDTDSLTIDVPLHRGCAMLRLNKVACPSSGGEMAFNGSFEMPEAPLSNYLPWGTPVDGWSVEGMAHPPLVISETYSSAFPAAPDGDQWGLIDLRPSFNGGGSLLQFVGLVEAGKTYRWQVTLGNRDDVGYLAPRSFGLYSLSNNVFTAQSVKLAADVTMPQRSGTTQSFNVVWRNNCSNSGGEPLYFKFDFPVYNGSSTAQLLIDGISVSSVHPGTILSLCS
ncbi:MAG: hypothetical protein PHO37_07080 [Kiritimatiellae bacterium]|nr:hypothetical protein [Kiritimatiellia bacterium]